MRCENELTWKITEQGNKETESKLKTIKTACCPRPIFTKYLSGTERRLVTGQAPASFLISLDHVNISSSSNRGVIAMSKYVYIIYYLGFFFLASQPAHISDVDLKVLLEMNYRCENNV